MRSKLDPKGVPGVFVGYSNTQKAWRIFIPDLRTIRASPHVRFDDLSDWRESYRSEGEHQYDLHQYDLFSSTPVTSSSRVDLDSPPPPAPASDINLPPVPDLLPAEDPPPARQPRQPRPLPPPRESIPRPAKAKSTQKTKEILQSSRRAPTPPPDEAEPPHSDDEQANIVSGEDPKSFRQAMASPDRHHWIGAMDTEFISIISLDSYELVELPSGANVIDTVWVFRIKRRPDGTIIQFKARLCARGFTQIYGVDYLETHAPVVKTDSIRLLLSMAATLDWEIHVIDVNSAFLNSEMPDEQEIYLRQPDGYVVEGKEHLVWRMKKALYGLKQSGHLWYKKLKSILTDIGFKTCAADPCVFFRTDSSGTCFILSHVDDLGLLGSSPRTILSVKSDIKKRVPIKDIGEMGQYLGMEVIRNRSARTISLSHRRYIDSMLETYGLKDVKPASTPLATGSQLSAADSPSSPEQLKEMRPIPYQSAVGALNHAAVMTRPDIAFAVHKVSQFCSNPGQAHWSAVKRIFRYLKGTRDQVLTLGGKSTNVLTRNLTAYSDADLANSPDNARSVSGFAMLFNNGCFAWSAKKQTVTALSTSEAEYYAAVHVGREILWIRELLPELGYALDHPTTLRVDNMSAIRIAEKPDEVTPRTKHVKIFYHWLREEIAVGSIAPEHVAGEENIADLFTKALPEVRHRKLSSMLGMSTRDDAR